ncbi:MAG: hypothetical protein JHC93_08610, partial [Parachlamydiales bacterium]|nr:hypothetical protein [Parachlamydiales bacterium]
MITNIYENFYNTFTLAYDNILLDKSECQTIVYKINNDRCDYIEELDEIFNQLNSEDSHIKTINQKKLDYITPKVPFDELIMTSLSADYKALLKVIKENACSNNETQRTRSQTACLKFLFTFQDSYKIINNLVEDILNQPSVEIRQYGLQFILLLIDTPEALVDEKNVLNGLKTALTMYYNPEMQQIAHDFCSKILKSSSAETFTDVKDELVDLSKTSSCHLVYELCSIIIDYQSNIPSLVAIAKKIPHIGIRSDDEELRRQALFFSHKLLILNPNAYINETIESMLIESRRPFCSSYVILTLMGLTSDISNDPNFKNFV